MFDPNDGDHIRKGLLEIYQKLSADGEHLSYLRIENIDYCTYGNSKPFRVKVVNEINDNHDYFYVKRADASRVYGLELEHIFSPDKISYLVDKETLVEENRLRLAKEFVKFNERCFIRLLGDMRAYNFVVEINQDFDNVQYRLRAMDFDQQSYEGRKNMYLPQFYKDNIALVELAKELMTYDAAEQYMKQERAAMRKRFQAARQRTRSLLRRMRTDIISSQENVDTLKEELFMYHGNPNFKLCKTMGEILILHLECKLGIKVFEVKSTDASSTRKSA